MWMEKSYSCQALWAISLLLAVQISSQMVIPTSTYPSKTNIEYIKTSCNVTVYPTLCYNSLSVYASKIRTDPKLLAHAALHVTLSASRSASVLMSKMSKLKGLNSPDAQALSDCMEQLSDSMDELRDSIGELKHSRGLSFELRMNDIETWVSAALTNEDSCMDEFGSEAVSLIVKKSIRRRIVKVAHLTSNALALINKYASSP